jgi:alpha-glucosidase
MSTSSRWSADVVYELCVPSFQDSNSDGLGDLNGISARLDYLHWLGVTALWLTPFYRTDFFDFGYDVIDHSSVDQRFGDMSDFDQLLGKAHQLGMKILIDFVPNHTSAKHAWFVDSRSSRSSVRRDWYIWRDARPGSDLPNNWTTQYETSAWAWDATTGQFYFHSFHENQPDLNWTNPDVQRAMASVLRFWLDRGVDGFRIDAMVHLAKDPQWRDNPPAPGKAVADWPTWPMAPAYTQDQAGLLPLLEMLCGVINEYPGRMIIGENHLSPGRLPSYYNVGLTHPINPQFLDIEWEPSAIRRAIDTYEGLLDVKNWPNWVFCSHDNARVATRLGESRTRSAAMLHLTLRGTPIIYYGEELGLLNAPIAREQEMDPLGRLMPGKGLGRDAQRAPLPWDDTLNCGFSDAQPWLPMPGRYRELGVQSQRADIKSLLHLYRKLLHFRASETALQFGDYLPDVLTDQVFAYIRQDSQSRFLVAINFSSSIAMLRSKAAHGAVVLSTELDRTGERATGDITLRPDEGILMRIRG